MNLRYLLLAAMVTLAACGSVASAHSSDTAPVDHEFIRSLLADEDNSSTKKQGNNNFMEHKLHKALTNPTKAKRLYQYWYKKGYNVEQVSGDLDQTENRELNRTYKKLARGYASYVKEQSA